MDIIAVTEGVVTTLHVEPGDAVAAGDALVTTELMKMQTVIVAPMAGCVTDLAVAVGDTVAAEQAIAVLSASQMDSDVPKPRAKSAPSPLIEELAARRVALSDAGRSERVARRHASGGRTAFENMMDLLDEGSFSEYGGHALAAQRSVHDIDTLIARSANDGVIVGTGCVDDCPVVVLIADYTVMAATQGYFHHKKVDRIIELAQKRDLPLIMFPEGGGGRPNDVDAFAISTAQLQVTSFQALAALANTVPVIAVVHGYCFAGSAAFASVADIIIATQKACIGMGGPAMIEGGGLGTYSPDDVGPAAILATAGVVDRVVETEAEATALAKELLLLAVKYRSTPKSQAPAQRFLDTFIPANRRAVFDPRDLLHGVLDVGSFIELKPDFGRSLVTGFGTIEDLPVGVLASDCRTLGGAIDGDAAAKAADFFELCQKWKAPIVSFVDTPGFMVGPEAEASGQAKPIGRMFKSAAAFSPPIITVVVRRAYGLGAMAMAGGGLHSSDLVVSWPSGEFGAMGLEGAVRLGFRDKLAACPDEESRNALFHDLVDQMAERGKALNAATTFEIDDVIMPSETRTRVHAALQVLSAS